MMRHWQIITIGLVVDVDEAQGYNIIHDLMNDYRDKVVWITGKEVYGSTFWVRSDHIIGMHHSTPETREDYRQYQRKMNEEGSGETWR